MIMGKQRQKKPCQTSNLECSAKAVNSFSAKGFILDALQGSENTSEENSLTINVASLMWDGIKIVKNLDTAKAKVCRVCQ